MKKKDIFISPSQGEVDQFLLIEELVAFMQTEPDCNYQLVIGTDSKTSLLSGKEPVDFVTAIVIHRLGRGGRYFWQRQRVEKLASLRDKIYTEALLSIKMAERVVPEFKQKLNGQNCQVEIHIDVGNKGETRDMIKEVVGMVTVNGYTAKTKPASFGATNVADRHT